jgi:hypothetical protein
MSPKDLKEEVLGMPPADRARLADELLASLESNSDVRFRSDWEAEVEGRIEAYERGDITSIDEKEAYRSIEAKLRS